MLICIKNFFVNKIKGIKLIVFFKKFLSQIESLINQTWLNLLELITFDKKIKKLMKMIKKKLNEMKWDDYKSIFIWLCVVMLWLNTLYVELYYVWFLWNMYITNWSNKISIILKTPNTLGSATYFCESLR